MRRDERPAISVVIPFYNCEGTVEACLDSVLAQTLTDFEVVCVDDGSTDGTGEKLDGYAKLDPRVKVFRQGNGGQASARNLGVRRAEADYVAFVDGDDVCSPYYLEAMAAHKSADVIVCGQNRVVSERCAADLRWEEPTGAKRLSAKEAMSLVLYNIIEEGPSCKLIPREILVASPFPPGRLYEDLAVVADIILSADHVVFLKGPIYAYVMHERSTVRCADCSIGKVEDYAHALKGLCQAVEARFDDLGDGIVFRRSLSYLRMRPLCQRVSDESRKAKEIERANAAFLRRNFVAILLDGRAPASHKARIALRIACPWLYDLFMCAYGLMRKGVA